MDPQHQHMRRAIELARLGEGLVEPNPMVGCVLADDRGNVIGEGYHQQFGGPHAEVVALQSCRGQAHTAYVTLEPCSHQGKTPPCSDALISAGLRRVFVAVEDPFDQVSGRGIARLAEAGIEVEVGLESELADEVLAPYLKRVRQGHPWVIAKWAMTLDGKIAARSGDSRWISNEASRARVHALRGRVDAIVVGIGTALADDPLLTARPAGPRVATRVVFDRLARLPLDSQLVKTCGEFPLIVVAGNNADGERVDLLRAAGVEVLVAAENESLDIIAEALTHLANKPMTNILVEGGSELLGAFFEGHWIDEVHAFISPQIIGGELAKSPIAGPGVERISDGSKLAQPIVEMIGDDIYVHGRLRRNTGKEGNKESGNA